MSYNDMEQSEAAAEALENFKKATEERRRAHIIALPEGERWHDITEDVVSLLDMIHSSMEWSSNLWSDTDLYSFIALCNLLKVDLPEEAPKPPLPAIPDHPQRWGAHYMKTDYAKEHDYNMVHNVRYGPTDPRGCPPNCPFVRDR